jgi:hypothetical protein
MSPSIRIRTPLAPLVLAGTLPFLAPAAAADTGFYLGGGIGNSSLQADVDEVSLGDVVRIDENDFAWKVFGGFNFDVPFVDLGVEVGYMDLGEVTVDVLGSTVGVEATGLTAYGVAAIDPGPFSLFAKAGVVNWDATVFGPGTSAEADGTDPAVGAGLMFGIGPVQLRGEFEYFDVDDLEDSYLASASVIWRF